jgi:hypothetical protein
MRLRDDPPLDPEVVAALDAIDATVAGDPVDPAYAELAELAVLLSAEPPRPSTEFADLMDRRLEERFAKRPAGPSAEGTRRRLPSWWLSLPAAGLAAAVVVAVVIASSSGPGPVAASSSLQGAAASSHGPARTASSSSSAAVKPSVSGRLLPGGTPDAESTASPSATPSLAASPPGLQLPQTNRKIVQSAQLQLSTPGDRIDAVAQEVFDVVGAQNGIVSHSSVTASGGPGAYAQFQLSVPSGNLQQTMTALSRLRFASVSSRTDTTQDVNNQYVGDVRALSDAKALRTALLKQLAQAVTTAQIDSLQAQIHDADAQISSDQSTLNALNHQVNYSQIQVTINGAEIVPVRHPGASGFTLGKAAHDAGRVLTVAAGVALITLAALVPIALLVALGLWVTTAIRRRRREQALDLA